jgi:transglutaminase-like putative cysteine protease
VTWRLDVVHRTAFHYETPVLASYNEARITPTTDLHQSTVSSLVSLSPVVPVRRYWDYWGTQVTAFDIHEPHDELVVTSASVVETEPAAGPAGGLGWSELADPALMDSFDELLRTTNYTGANAELAAAAREIRERSKHPSDAWESVGAWVHDSLTYESGVTGVHTSATEAWQARRGVCQDYAHVALVMLRSIGVPARYVSGYLHPRREAEVGESVGGESHAWVEAWVGQWWGLDPTNNEPIGERHVGVGRGRDYADVSPLRGVLSGGQTQSLDVEVTLTRSR